MITEEIIGTLKAHGGKITPQRIAVYRALCQLKHACVEEIKTAIHHESPTVTLATVYNTLDYFCRAGIITQINVSKQKMFFDITSQPHHHLFNPETEKIKDFEDEGFQKMIEAYLQKNPIPGFTLSDIQIQLRGKFQE